MVAPVSVPAPVSVIVPCHNYARYLPQALDSILGQSRPPAEVIVIDDGSSDGSADIARAFGSRVVVRSQAQQGIAATRNAGLDMAGQGLIAFLDADDLWTPDSLALRLAALEAQPALSCIFGQTEHFMSPEVDEATRARLACPRGAAVARFVGAMLVRRDVFDRIGRFDTAFLVSEMMDWSGRLDDSDVAVGQVEALVMRRRVHGDNSTLSPAAKGDYLRALKAAVRRRAQA
ncbi:glycosyltransferase family A protein [Sphingomonas naphthae]|uniref:Glycosyltransferase family A protein n=1 Tax=Sphingomonas naphthae TaxID=1813468 RepID=A0ABY7TPS7_9SPHN|nr:glycosyltransferase family A protein [Sphingomonas naphthae]WCT74940.1 glycosyltransferase family A protein [Sphingomonas naphthae]